jgi:anaerobic ribonucleoside-triphosphate reductase activating protein
MRYSKIRSEDISNGPGIRVSIFVQGCEHHCSNCFNKETWDFNKGHEYTNETKDGIINLMNNNKVVGFSILGGEPLQQDKKLLDLIISIKNKYPNKTIWMWTGYEYENLTEEQLECIKYIDVLVDGKYIEKYKCPNELYKGSSNQRIIDIQQTLKTNTIQLYSLH